MAATSGNTPYDYEISARVTSDRGDIELDDLFPALFTVELYENINKPWLTGKVILTDNVGLFNKIKFRGTEKLELAINFPNDDSKNFERTFIITKIESRAKAGNDFTSVILFHLVEDSYFISRINLVNNVFDGKISDIMALALTEASVNRDISGSSQESQEPIRFISPNWPAMKIIQKLTPFCTTDEGFPYFAYSSIANDNSIIFKNLQEMLTDNPINGNEFIYSQGLAGKLHEDTTATVGFGEGQIDPVIALAITGERSPADAQLKFDIAKKGLLIDHFTHNGTYDLLESINNGSIECSYSIQNMNQGVSDEARLNYAEVLSSLSDSFPNDQKTTTYDPVSFDGIHSKNTNVRGIVYTSNIYTDGSANQFDLEIQNNPQRMINAGSLRNNILMDHIVIRVPGYHFWDNGGAGNSIRLKFLSDDGEAADVEDFDRLIDQKLTGSYLMYSAKHVFSLNKYFVETRCFKYSELGVNNLESISSTETVSETGTTLDTTPGGAGGSSNETTLGVTITRIELPSGERARRIETTDGREFTLLGEGGPPPPVTRGTGPQ